LTDHTKPLISIVICVRNGESSIGCCIQGILKQRFDDYELILIDDASTDKTASIIKRFQDSRIKYYKNPQWYGISKSRNEGLKKATGCYIFYTDADCTIEDDWIQEGLNSLRQPKCVGVEGKIVYVSKNYQPTYSDHVMENLYGGNFMTGNAAYRVDILRSVGGFNEKLTYLEDREVAFKIMKFGKILFNPNMIVYHPKVVLTPKRYIKSAAYTKNRIYLKRFGDKKCFLGPIIFPGNLLKILFPPAILASLFFNKFKTSDDYRLLPLAYVFAVSERLNVWLEGARERVFVI
jgi:glycosyltransferase involved in cell wall biosynthesis